MATCSSALLIDLLAILNRKIHKDVYKAKLSKRVTDAMETTFDDIADDLGNVTDLEDIKADFEDFDVAVKSTGKPISISKKRKHDENEHGDVFFSPIKEKMDVDVAKRRFITSKEY